MLKRIRCEKFRVKEIIFKEGFNVVKGDDSAANSIGKSTLLMLIDFALGGNSFFDHNSDVPRELDNHLYYFEFIFKSVSYYFARSTVKEEDILLCNNNWEPIDKMDIKEFRGLLLNNYNLKRDSLSFRAFIGLFSRVWGKDNLSLKKPLNSIASQSYDKIVILLLKLFKKYSRIKELIEINKELSDKRSILQKAYGKELVPKINKSQYKENDNKIKEAREEIEDIKSQLSLYALNLSEITNRELFDLKMEKDELIALKAKVRTKLARIERNLTSSRYIKSKHFARVVDFFPEINQDRLLRIEEFHDNLSLILKKELSNSKQRLQKRYENIEKEISEIDVRLSSLLSDFEDPDNLVDRVYRVTSQINKSSVENEYYEKLAALKEEVNKSSQEVAVEQSRSLSEISNMINETISKLTDEIQNGKRRPPTLNLLEKSYSFTVVDDTGTGKAFIDLIILDLSIQKLTDLPILIHDSLLFKNIENESVVNLFKYYKNLKIQSFVAIDEVPKYGLELREIVRENQVIELNNNNLLYTKDWRIE